MFANCSAAVERLLVHFNICKWGSVYLLWNQTFQCCLAVKEFSFYFFSAIT